MKLVPDDVSAFFLKNIRETVDYRQENKIERNDFMDLMLKIKNKSKDSGEEEITFNELAAQCFVFFVAGKLIMENYVKYTHKPVYLYPFNYQYNRMFNSIGFE